MYLFIYLFIYFSCAESLLLHGLFSSFGEWGLLSSWGVQASHCSDFSCCRAQSPGYSGFNSCGSWALEHRFNSCGIQTWLFHSMWEPPKTGIKPVSSALAGKFSTTEPPGKSQANKL